MNQDRSKQAMMSRVLRAVKVALLIFGLLIVGLGAIAYLAGEREWLPFEYEGFD